MGCMNMSLPKSIYTFAIAVLTISAFAISLVYASPADAKSKKRCMAKALEIVHRQDGGVIMRRKLREQNGYKTYRFYACSLDLRRRVNLGMNHSSPDGEGGPTGFVINSRFVVFTTYGGGPAGGGFTGNVRLHDLRTGRLVKNVPSSSTFGTSLYVGQLLLQSDGTIAWTARVYDPDPNVQQVEVYLSDRNGTRMVATGPNIHPKFLYFDPGSNSLVWSTSNATAPLRLL